MKRTPTEFTRQGDGWSPLYRLVMVLFVVGCFSPAAPCPDKTLAVTCLDTDSDGPACPELDNRRADGWTCGTSGIIRGDDSVEIGRRYRCTKTDDDC